MDVGGGEKRPLEESNGEEPVAKRFQSATLAGRNPQTQTPVPASAAPAPAPAPGLDLSALAALGPDVLAQLPALLQSLQGGDPNAASALTAQLLASALQAGSAPAAAPVPATVPGLTPQEASDANTASNLLTAQLLANALQTQAPMATAPPAEPEAVTASVGCPVAHVGRIIGKGGEMIKNLQKTFLVKIQIDQKSAGQTERRVHVSGPRANVDAAVDRIHSMIQQGIAQAAAEDSMGMAAAAAPAPMPQVNPGHITHKIICPDEQVGRVIGRGGENIRQTEAATGAKVQVARKEFAVAATEVLSSNRHLSTWKVNQKMAPGIPREVTISGLPENVNKAIAVVTALINGESIANAARTKVVNGDSKAVIACPRDKVGRVIGKGGENIRLMEEKSGGTDIQVPCGLCTPRIRRCCPTCSRALAVLAMFAPLRLIKKACHPVNLALSPSQVIPGARTRSGSPHLPRSHVVTCASGMNLY
eukprot:scaffold1790_cov257-Pinguiococcus_pyrenoidosus.AAC.49